MVIHPIQRPRHYLCFIWQNATQRLFHCVLSKSSVQFFLNEHFWRWSKQLFTVMATAENESSSQHNIPRSAEIITMKRECSWWPQWHTVNFLVFGSVITDTTRVETKFQQKPTKRTTAYSFWRHWMWSTASVKFTHLSPIIYLVVKTAWICCIYKQKWTSKYTDTVRKNQTSAVAHQIVYSGLYFQLSEQKLLRIT